MAVYSQDGRVTGVNLVGVAMNKFLLTERSGYFGAFYRNDFEGDRGKTFVDFRYPMGAIFTPAEFYLALLILNSREPRPWDPEFDVGLIPLEPLVALSDYFDAEYLIHAHIERTFDIQKAHQQLVDLLKFRNWESMAVLHLLHTISYHTGLEPDEIQTATISIHTQLPATARLRNLIRTRVRTANRFWQTQYAANPRRRCVLCSQPLDHTAYLSGPYRQIEHLVCCYALVHYDCLKDLLNVSRQRVVTCPSCQTPWSSERIDDELDTLHSIQNRNLQISNRRVCTARRTFRRVAARNSRTYFHF